MIRIITLSLTFRSSKTVDGTCSKEVKVASRKYEKNNMNLNAVTKEICDLKECIARSKN